MEKERKGSIYQNRGSWENMMLSSQTGIPRGKKGLKALAAYSVDRIYAGISCSS